MQLNKLSPQIFTDSVKPYIDFLDVKFEQKPLCVSDIRDRFNKQYVDLVQEGGGVHGIALAGYTYVLEKMGISFMKMAGTSAGSINTLLLNSVYTRAEAEELNVKGNYYETRSEKVLEYLANKPLTDMVDGHPAWRKLLLKMFTGAVGMGPVMNSVKAIKRRVIIFCIVFLLLLICSLLLAFNRPAEGVFEIVKWTTLASVSALVILSVLLMARVFFIRFLYRNAERFGINPGDDFENWIRKDILEKNGIMTVNDLKEKLHSEEAAFVYRYDTCNAVEAGTNGTELTHALDEMLKKIKNTKVKIDDLFDHLNEFIFDQEEEFLKKGNHLTLIMQAFEHRLKETFTGVSKEIVIVSSDITHEIKVEFPGMHKMYWGENYDISPAKYVRASMSVPFFFKPFKIDFSKEQKETIEKEWHQYVRAQRSIGSHALLVDGGMLSNFPINVFYSQKIPVPRMPTFGIKLEYEDDTAPPGEINTLMGFCGKLVSTMRFFYDRDFILKHDMYQKTVRSIDTGKIHWLNFSLTEEQKVELFFRGALAATIFLAKHAIEEKEVVALKEMGQNVNYGEHSFSIYHGEKTDFKIEDCLVKNITFEWQDYKKQRMLAQVNKKVQTKTLKQGAALAMNETPVKQVQV